METTRSDTRKRSKYELEVNISMQYRDSLLQESNRDCAAIAEIKAEMTQREFPEEEIAVFTEKAALLLDKCAVQLGSGTPFRYAIEKHFGRVRLRILFMNALNPPLPEEDDTVDSVSEFVSNLFMNDNASFISYRKIQNRTFIALYSAVKPREKHALKSATQWFRSPLLWAIVLGVVCGLVCQRLPENIRSFLVDGLADPIGDIVLALIAGVTGPVIFLSLITSITSLGSISKLTDMGFKIMWRFIKCTLFIIAVSIAVSLLFYSAFGAGTIQFSPDQLVSMLLKLVPTNIVAPFLNNDTPQLVILGLLLGAALLFLEDRVANLTATLRSLQAWSSSVMRLVFVLTPAIPFLSLFKAFADDKASVLLDGWEFIVCVVFALAICCLFKLVKVSLRCKLSIPVLLKKTLPMASLAFSAGSENATLNMQIEHSRSKLGISQAFSDFWIPMSHAMFKPRTTIHLVIPPFLIAKAMGMPISQSFLFVLILTVLELSVASSGITGAWTILFAALGLPLEYVGLYVVYKVFTTNIACGGCEFYYTLEQIEASCVLDTIDRSCYEEEQ